MAGLYLHIPFCRQACHYCDFHFSTSLRLKEPLLQALHRELELRREYLQGAELQSIYFGGGTPSLLDIEELERLFDKIFALHRVAPDAEITLEANPDDLTPEKCRRLAATPLNRLSIGVQSFHDEDLRFMNRAHDARQARTALDAARAGGFDNLSLDLIYGTPTLDEERWLENLRLALRYGVPHLSCYSLTVEPRTALAAFIQQGKVPAPDEGAAARQFELLMDFAAAEGFDHYEISNFARPGFIARHNSAYWRGQPYLGIGPSAHSFDGQARQWNVAHNPRYIRALERGELPAQTETLTPAQRYNEYVLTGLRTRWGCTLEGVGRFGEAFPAHFLQAAEPHLLSGALLQQEGRFTLSRSGKLLADRIALDLFVEVED